MKQNLKKIALFVCAAFALAGCKNEDVATNHYDNKLFLSTVEYTDLMLVKPNSTDQMREIVVGIAKREAHEISIAMRVAPELVETFSKAYYEQGALMLPEECYVFEQTETKIQVGSVKSTPLPINFINFKALDRELCYVLPVTIDKVVGIETLNSARTMYFVFKGAALINVVADINENKAWPDWKDAAPVTDMTQFTLEALVYGNTFNKQISTLMGIEGKFLLRFGDSGVEPNQLQIASSRNLTSADLQIEPNKWYHIAVTFDAGTVTAYINGSQKLSGYCGTSSVNLGVKHSDESNGQARCFWIGYSYNDERYLDGRIAEARIWNRALTAEEINAPNHFYLVDTESEGLVAYWKFDEGAGTIVKDYSVYGNNLTIDKTPKWVSVSLPAAN